MKDNNPLVSVVVVTYNSSKYVIETLDSIKLQTYNNIELIITDDCSQDDTVKICDDWINRNKDRFVRTLVVTSPINTGIPSNVNRGVKASNGKWIKGIAGDDLLEVDCINEFLNYAIEYGYQFVYSQMTLFDDGHHILNIIPDISYENPKTCDEQMQQLFKDKFRLNAPSWIFSRQLYDLLGGFNESYKLFEDVPFFFKALQNSYTLCYLKKPLVRYRLSNSVSNVESWSEKQYVFYKCKHQAVRELFVPEMRKRRLYLLMLKNIICMWSYENYFETDKTILKLFYRLLYHFSFKMI